MLAEIAIKSTYLLADFQVKCRFLLNDKLCLFGLLLSIQFSFNFAFLSYGQFVLGLFFAYFISVVVSISALLKE